MNSTLFTATLKGRDKDQHASERDRLRNALLSFRDRAANLATEISKDLPALTVHDITHLDALWGIASLIVGEAYPFTPTEAFVFGGSVLLHDLALSVASVEGGINAIKGDPRWADLVVSEYRSQYNRDPDGDEKRDPAPKIMKPVLFSLLRQVHAENAERLAFISYPSTDGTPMFLIEDTELRQTFGHVMGRIAHSHWWSVDRVEKEFPRVAGAPPWCPSNWTLDPIKIACMLRSADSAHLDGRRAPSFLKGITAMSESGEIHWRFQEKLNKPYLREDALVFTSGASFRIQDAGAWWLCLESLRAVDRELRGVDTLLADRAFARFSARRVAGVESPERLSEYVQTEGWLPINATIHVSDLPAVIKSLGGEELYGKNPRAALRELIQNSCDAVRARRLYERRDRSFGSVTVSLTSSAGNTWLEVTDTGVGMSQRVLTDFLLDFGRSFWGSPEMQEEFPGLLSSGVKPTGKYGIGFFSVFMVGSQVQVITRRSDAAAKDTMVLEFATGLAGRPALRPAERGEQLIDGGTVVRVKCAVDPAKEGGLLSRRWNPKIEPLEEICRRIAPAIDVDLFVNDGASNRKVIGANDWEHIPGVELLHRMEDLGHERVPNPKLDEFRERAAHVLTLVKGKNGETLGRACISAGHASSTFEATADLSGVITVGGLTACGLSGIIGVLVGEPTRASRDAARPSVSRASLKKWAEEQADLAHLLWAEPEKQSACARYIRMLGGNTKDLPVAFRQGRWWSAVEIAKTAAPETAIIVPELTINFRFRALRPYELDDSVFVAKYGSIPGLLQAGYRDHDWPEMLGEPWDMAGLAGVVVESLALAWNVDLKDVLAANSLERETDVVVGSEGDRELRIEALIIKKPATSAT